MDTQDATIRNADLWTKYFQDEWSRWLSPLGSASGAAAPMAGVAEGTGARVASFLTLVAAGPIAWMYSANRPSVVEIRLPADDTNDENLEKPAA